MNLFKCSVCGKEEWLETDGDETKECLKCGNEMFIVDED